MSCVFPLDAWRAAKCNESGKRGIVFNIRDGLVDEPLSIPCGKCVGCCADRALVWSVRMHHEASMHRDNCFVTFTYAEPCPATLDKRHLQVFFRELRRVQKVRYFACGEYGTRTRRPHYHAVLFGVDFKGGAYEISDSLYGNPILDACWQRGFCSVGDVSLQSCMYVAGYVNKKIGDPDTFNMMSLRPGIGHSWLDKYRADIVRTGKVIIDGQEFPVPKKYLEWYEDDFSELVDERKRYFKELSPDDVCFRREQLRPKQIMYDSRLAMKSELL